MDVREKLVEILEEPCGGLYPACELADYLLDQGVTVQNWIPITERLPEEKGNCIVHYKHAYCDNDDYWAIGICFYDGEKFQMGLAYKATHWMPLPQPPYQRGGQA